MAEEESFRNMESYRGGSGGKLGLSFKQIIIQHCNRCVLNGSQEFRGGFNREISVNPTITVYVPDTRETYFNSVRMLRALLLGYFDNEAKAAIEKLDKEWIKRKEADIKKIADWDAVKAERQFDERDDLIDDLDRKRTRWNVEFYIELFEQLVLLTKRLNFFEEETSTEEA